MRFANMQRMAALAVGTLLVFGSSVAAGQSVATPSTTLPTSSDSDAPARARFARGRDAYEHGDFAVALDAFQAAYALSQNPKLLYNVGLASQKLGLVTEAVAAFEGYLAWGQGDRGEEVRGRVAALRDMAHHDAAFAPADTRSAPTPAETAAAAPEAKPAPPSAPAEREARPRRKWWPYALAAGVIAIAAVAVAVPLAHKDGHEPRATIPNTGLVIDALRRAP